MRIMHEVKKEAYIEIFIKIHEKFNKVIKKIQ